MFKSKIIHTLSGFILAVPGLLHSDACCIYTGNKTSLRCCCGEEVTGQLHQTKVLIDIVSGTISGLGISLKTCGQREGIGSQRRCTSWWSSWYFVIALLWLLVIS